MSTTAQRRAAVKRRRERAEKAKEKEVKHGDVKLSVHVAACWERGLKPDNYGNGYDDFREYPGYSDTEYTTVRKIYLDQFGNLVAQGKCGDLAFVCKREELSGLAEFLTALAANDVTKAYRSLPVPDGVTTPAVLDASTRSRGKR